MSPEDNFYRDALIRMREVLIYDIDQITNVSWTDSFTLTARRDALEYVVAMMDNTLGYPTETDEERNARRSTPEGQEN